MTAPLPPLVLKGDCIDEMRRIPDASVDAVVTDPPYGLEFMGHEWDRYTPGDFQHWCELWAREALRILKPGGHMLAFGGARTWHRLAAGIEDAGFEIRDSIAWLYGSGMPKSMDVSKAIDKLDAAALRLERARTFQAWLAQHMTPKRVNEITGTDMGHHLTTHPSQPAIATAPIFDMLRPHLPSVPAEIEVLVAERTVESENYGKRGSTGKHEKRAGVSEWRERYSGGAVADASEKRDVAHTPEAEAWQGWGTGLKPAFEPVVVARKPLPYRSTVAANVVEYGTGALNIDASRIENAEYDPTKVQRQSAATSGMMGLGASGYHADHEQPTYNAAGRWPTNVILDESQAAALDAQSGFSKSPSTTGRGASTKRSSMAGGILGAQGTVPAPGDSGGASRFFYVAKAPKSERPVVDGIVHPTVKPLAIMRYLLRLVVPPGGCVVDPFAGSGTTLEAAYLEGFEAIGCEMTPDYWPLIAARIERVTR